MGARNRLGSSGRAQAEAIINQECASAGIQPWLVVSHSRRPHITAVRWKIAHRLRAEMNLTVKLIGQLLGRSHQQIVYGLKQYAKGIKPGKHSKRGAHTWAGDHPSAKGALANTKYATSLSLPV